jgi:serine kinase of HPr protein (carbohydrate metabolism regulator)
MTSFIRLHSGGVVRNGVASLLLGPSGAGKSTLVTRLVADGFSLLSDDEIWIDLESGLAHPTARWVLLKDSAWDLFPHHRRKFVDSGATGCRSWWLEPEDLRPGCRAAASPVDTVIVVEPVSRTRPALERMGQTEALGRLLTESMNFPEVRGRGLSVLVNIVRAAKTFKLTNGDLDACAEILDGVLQ